MPALSPHPLSDRDQDHDRHAVLPVRLAALQGAIASGAACLLELASAPDRGGARRWRLDALHEPFDLIAPRLLKIGERHLHPALIESMAGSDAVCLRRMTAASASGQCRLGQRWPGVRVAVGRLYFGDPSTGDADAVRDFAMAWLKQIEHDKAELLPMIERLLDDSALAVVGLALDAVERT